MALQMHHFLDGLLA